MDTGPLADAIAEHRDRLRLMVRWRMDRRLQGRLDASDVLQEAFLEASRRYGEYEGEGKLPIFLWMRYLVAQQILIEHRRHLGVQARDAGREVSIQRFEIPEATSAILASELVATATTPSEAVAKMELERRVQESLESMDPIDREALVLRHFEQLTNKEAAQVLGITATAASQRYVRALIRLKSVLSDLRSSLEG